MHVVQVGYINAVLIEPVGCMLLCVNRGLCSLEQRVHLEGESVVLLLVLTALV